jgi:hypothetical protein
MALLYSGLSIKPLLASGLAAVARYVCATRGKGRRVHTGRKLLSADFWPQAHLPLRVILIQTFVVHPQSCRLHVHDLLVQLRVHKLPRAPVAARYRILSDRGFPHQMPPMPGTKRTEVRSRSSPAESSHYSSYAVLRDATRAPSSGLHRAIW